MEEPEKWGWFVTRPAPASLSTGLLYCMLYQFEGFKVAIFSAFTTNNDTNLLFIERNWETTLLPHFFYQLLSIPLYLSLRLWYLIVHSFKNPFHRQSAWYKICLSGLLPSSQISSTVEWLFPSASRCPDSCPAALPVTPTPVYFFSTLWQSPR